LDQNFEIIMVVTNSITLILWSGFVVKYFSFKKPMTREEFDALVAKATENEIHETKFETLWSPQNNREFYTFNFMKSCKEAHYKDSYVGYRAKSPEEAQQLYNKEFMPPIFKRLCHPVYAGEYLGSLFADGHRPWDRMCIMRYRSVEDMLRAVVEYKQTNNFDHKWAALEKTQSDIYQSSIPIIGMIVSLVVLLFIWIVVSILVYYISSKF